MSQQRISRSSSDDAKLEDFVSTKLLEFSKNLATKEDIDEIKIHFTKLFERLDYQENKIAALEKEGVDHEERISSLEEKVWHLANKLSEISDTASNLVDKNAVLSSSVDFLTKQGDHQEQYSRRACLRVNGIEKVNDESASNCVEKVIKVFKDMNVDISASDIDRAHRVGREKKTMIVKFYSFAKRTAAYKARKNATNNIKVHLDLTKARLELLDKAKELIAVDCSVDFVFADINCNCVARMKSNVYKFFDNLDTFKDKILNKK